MPYAVSWSSRCYSINRSILATSTMHNMPLLFAVIFLCVRGDGSFGHREDETRVITDASHTKWTARTQTQFGRVLVVMADNRRVEPVSGEGVQQYWSVSYELARRWACRHGYNITYYRFSEYHVLEKPTMSITGFQNPIAACRQASVGWREAAFCKLVAVGDALSQQNFDTVLWMDSDLFISRPELNLDDIVAQNPPLTCCKLYQTPPPASVMHAAINQRMPNSGLRRTGHGRTTGRILASSLHGGLGLCVNYFLPGGTAWSCTTTAFSNSILCGPLSEKDIGYPSISH